MKNIVIIGFMAAGKTTIGRELSKKLDFAFIDTDIEIEKNEKMKISDMFEKKGEDYFRNLETKILKDSINKKNIILSTGGGIIVRKVNIPILKNIGTIVWLNGNRKTIIEHLKCSDIDRPLLRDPNNIEEKIDELLSKRYDIYKQSCDLEININDKNIQEVTSEILFKLR
ncbi:MAG TPA: shikimate kinase [Peptostreptococcaceae bacterium]|nr:shikimate kinase [Peptostreptococcaceae bacterium]